VTWLEIVDSAVKIGLGALIAGVSSWALARNQYVHELRKSKVTREFELLKDIAEKVERFTHSALKYWAISAEWHKARRTDPEAPKSTNLLSTQKELFGRFNELTSAEAFLLLLGRKGAQAQLRAYGEHVMTYRRAVSRAAKPMSDGEIDDYRSYILRARESFFEQLNAMYRELGP
jgi:hypothetical protein